MDPAVVAEGVRKVYDGTVALADVSLSIEPGEVFVLIGPNGAGKTTLVRALTGTTVPDAGDVSVLGAAPSAVDRDELGVLPQAFSPAGRLSARELLAYYAGLYADARDPEAVLADVGLADAGDTWYENLSGGQQRRVCVGATLVNDPSVLVLDEPTTGIDPAGRRTVWRLIESLAAAGTTVLVTTHDMAEASRLGDRVGLLAAGDLVAVGTPERLIAEHAGPSRLEIVTTSDPAALEGLGAALGESHTLEVDVDAEAGRRRPSNAATDVEGRRVVVRGVTPASLGAVVAALEERGVSYTGLTWREPDLEDVYLAIAADEEGLDGARYRALGSGGSGGGTGGGERR